MTSIATNGPPRASVILVNYNGKHHLECCLESLRRSSFRDFETLLVDNGSTDGSVAFVRDRYPWVRVLEMGHNAGFASANNLAAAQAQADLLAFLNNDVEVTPDWLFNLVGAAERDPKTAAWASKMMLFEHRRLINGVGGAMNQVGYTFDRGMYERDRGQYDPPAEVFFPCAGACLVRRDWFWRAGGFDERFFMYHEDVDLGWSLWLLGGRVETVPSAVVYHHFGGTSKATMGVARREHMGERNNIRSLLKHYEWPNLAHALGLLLRQRQSPARKWQLLRNVAWNVRHLRETLALRRKLQRERRRTDAQLQRLILPGVRVPLTLPDFALATPQTFRAGGRKVYQITMGENELGCLSYGWHHLEPNPGGDGRSVRWTQGEACFYLSGDGGHRQVRCRVYALSKSAPVPVSGVLRVNDQEAGRFACPGDGWYELAFTLPQTAPVLELQLQLDSVWSPAQAFGNDDPRPLGVGVQAIWLQ